MEINEAMLDEKLEALEKARTWSPRVISKLESFIHAADDFQLFRINPLRIAAEKNIQEQDAIDLFLFGTKFGLFHMNWELVCPSCGALVRSFAELKNLHANYYCVLCELKTNAALDDYIQVAFTIAPTVRPISFHHPESLPLADYISKYHYQRGAFAANGVLFADLAVSAIHFSAYVEPGETRQTEVNMEAGYLVWHDFVRDIGGRIALTGAAAAEPQMITLTVQSNQFTGNVGKLAPGPIRVAVENRDIKRAAAALVHLPPEHQNAPVVLEPFLTGKRVLNMQTFRDLFRSEVIQSGDGLSVKDLTVLFTDLKGSTALYDRIGDLNAFALVRQHFDSLGAVIRQNSGAVVKTIGDAVMATFINPLDGVRAALFILREIEALNRDLGSRDVILKIGLHKGGLIAVTLNDRLDYFGQTVNIASRVQGLADAEEIYVTDAIYEFPGVQDLLKDYQVTASDAQFKGVEREVKVHKIVYSSAHT